MLGPLEWVLSGYQDGLGQRGKQADCAVPSYYLYSFPLPLITSYTPLLSLSQDSQMLGTETPFHCTLFSFQDTTPALSPPFWLRNPAYVEPQEITGGRSLQRSTLTLRLCLFSCGISGSIFEEKTTPAVAE